MKLFINYKFISHKTLKKATYINTLPGKWQ